MDAEIKQEFRSLHERIDQHHEAVMRRFHGERGDNGLFGRVQTLEERDAAREKAEERHYQHQKWRWNIAASSGAVGLTTGVWSLLKAYFGAKQ